MNPPSVSIIIVNFNGGRWLASCLEAIQAQRGGPLFEIIVVDNASTDGSREIARACSGIRIVESRVNLGFAEGNNAGAKAALGEWLVFLNNDTVADPEWLSRLHGAAIDRPEFSVLTSRIVFLADPSRIDSAGDGYYRAGGAFKIGHGEQSDAWSTSSEVFGACGAAMMIRRDAFETLGGFDPRFFMVYEDVDLSYRARLRGMRVWYEASAVVRHVGSASIGTLSRATVFYGQRNLEWTWVKNTPTRLLIATAISHIGYSVAGVLFYVARGRGGAAIGGKLSALGHLWRVLADRRAIQQSRVVDGARIEPWMSRRWLASKRHEKASDLVRASRADGPS